MDQVMAFVEPGRQFAKDSLRLVKRCTKPDRKEMASFGFWLIVILGVIYLESESVVRGEAVNSMEAEARPQRPRVFTSPDELRNYLEALSKYYALAGRPRFGKRAPTREVNPIKSIPNLSLLDDVYDALQSNK